MAPPPQRKGSLPRTRRYRGGRLPRAGPPACRRTAASAPSFGLQLAVNGSEDPEPEQNIDQSQVRRRVERGDPADERLHGDVKAHPDVRIQWTAGIVDQLERHSVDTVFQVQMERRVVRQVRVGCTIE